ncbi:hypothetical protein Nepgr_031704 [Nepenthes gracilis]|uniref:DUF538 family protein n=1 Tax=Nepenthes gracilis TaxID=150966 RepID=A0AAD3TIM8_NEPGR|nr:hypothetical protein Nepgr_031704 [Nepenthes gracilis]
MATHSTHDNGERAGAEIVYGAEDCRRYSVALLEELGFPKGVLPLVDLVEYGRVRATGFVWMKQKAASEHYLEATKTPVSYAAEVTAYVEKGKMKRMSGVKSKPLLFWLPVTEMSIEDKAAGGREKIYFKTALGIGKSLPATAFMTAEEKEKN